MKPISIHASLALFAFAALAACGGGKEAAPDASTSGGKTAKRTVVVYSPHGQEMLDEYEAAFEKANPGIDVVGRFIPTGKILSQLEIDKGHQQIDVWWGGTSAFFNQAKGEGLLAPYKPTCASALPPGYSDPADMWVAQFIQVPAIMFNKDLIKPENAPAHWDDLLKPDWKDRIVIREPMDSGTMKTIFAGVVWARGGEAGDTTKGYEFLKSLDAQTRKYLPAPQALYDQVAKSAEGYISLWNVTDVIYQAQANGYPFGYRIPDDEVPVSLDCIALIAGAPHAEEAKLFYEFVTSSEQSAAMAKKHFRLLARTDIPAAELPAWQADIKFKAMKIDWAAFDAKQQEWMDHWRKSIRNPEK